MNEKRKTQSDTRPSSALHPGSAAHDQLRRDPCDGQHGGVDPCRDSGREMTERTLEEIEAAAKALGSVPWADAEALYAIANAQRTMLDAVFAAIDEIAAACEDQKFGWSERKDAARTRLETLRKEHRHQKVSA